MAGYSARQSSFTTGDTILAAHSNDEFNQVLAAFHATTGHSHDGTAGEGGPVSTLRDADALNKILVDTTNNHLEFYVEVSSAAVQQLRIQDGAIVPITDNDIDLGTSSLEFKDLYVDGTAYVDAINYNGTAIASTAAELNIVDGDTSATSTTVADADRVVLNDNGTMVQVAVTDLAAYFDDEITAMPNLTSVGTLTTLTVDDITINGSTVSDSGDFTIDGGADIILGADGGDIFFKDGGTTFGSATNTSGNLIIKSGTTTALTFSGADVTIAGDLTVSGDDITMGTNTAGNLLVADGTNFNSVAVGSLSEISTVASDDVLLAVDTSGGGLKKITRSTLTAGIVSGSEISNVVEDTSPQLGGNLDMNGQDIVTTSNADIELAPNGTGHVTVKGNTNQGAIQFNCENNSHGQQIKAAPHSESASNVLTIPSTGGDSTLVSDASTSTLTNKTLTTPIIAEIDSGSSITLDATTDIVLDAGGADVTLKDDGTTFGSLTNSSGELVIKSGSTPTTAMTFSGANVTFAGTVTIGSAGISEAELEILDGATVTTAELNILDGVTSTAAELNILDGVTSTAAELNILDGVTSTAAEINIIDGDTSAVSTTLVDADRLVTNDAGTMKQVALTDVKTYLSSAGFSTTDPTALAIALG